jgi:hypothetical protein
MAVLAMERKCTGQGEFVTGIARIPVLIEGEHSCKEGEKVRFQDDGLIIFGPSAAGILPGEKEWADELVGAQGDWNFRDLTPDW